MVDLGPRAVRRLDGYVVTVHQLQHRAMTKIVVLTGAGISAESGVPTFRDANGLWEGYEVDEVATPRAFEARPDIVHAFYDARRASLETVEPNPAHRRAGPAGAWRGTASC